VAKVDRQAVAEIDCAIDSTLLDVSSFERWQVSVDIRDDCDTHHAGL
jgi:hypothetical protein